MATLARLQVSAMTARKQQPALTTAQVNKSASLFCYRCKAALGRRWKDRDTSKWIDTRKFHMYAIVDQSVPLCDPCYSEVFHGRKAAPPRVTTKGPLVDQITLFDTAPYTVRADTTKGAG